MRLAYLLALLPAAVAIILAANAGFGHETGVAGTPGAFLALAGAVLVALGLLLAALPQVRGRMLWTLNALIGIGALLTAVAAWFLMQNLFAIAMLLTLLVLILAVAFPIRKAAA